jgi:hypothetical protein
MRVPENECQRELNTVGILLISRLQVTSKSLGILASLNMIFAGDDPMKITIKSPSPYTTKEKT